MASTAMLVISMERHEEKRRQPLNVADGLGNYIYIYMGSRPKTPTPFTVKLDPNTLKETCSYLFFAGDAPIAAELPMIAIIASA